MSLINFMNGELLNSTSVISIISDIQNSGDPFAADAGNKPAECVAL